MLPREVKLITDSKITTLQIIQYDSERKYLAVFKENFIIFCRLMLFRFAL